MKKILILFVVLFSLISVERLHTVEDTEQIWDHKCKGNGPEYL